jgi:hypothetical protein
MPQDAQFFHVESYARAAGKGKAGGHNIRSILAEAKREPGATPHVSAPAPPVPLFGNLEDVEGMANAWADDATDGIGRKLRKDGLCLAAGVVSVPSGFTDWDRYKLAAVAWLEDFYGDRLVAVVEHADEAKRHIHFFAVPRLGDPFESLHPGKLAAKKAAEAGVDLKGRNEAYKNAMRGLQRKFWSEVSARFGLAAKGPGRTRLTRAEWVARRKEAEAVAEEIGKWRTAAEKSINTARRAFALAEREKMARIEAEKALRAVLSGAGGDGVRAGL